MELLLIVTTVLIVLKLTGKIDWSWVAVLAFLWIPFLVFLFFFLAMVVCFIAVS